MTEPVAKVACPTCGKKVKGVGLEDHQRAVHEGLKGLGRPPIYIGGAKEPISPEHRAQSCTGKVRFRERGAAKKEARRLYGEVGPDLGPVSVYPCAYCHGWHVGKSTKLILARVQVVAAA
jgi:hypothetical protein